LRSLLNDEVLRGLIRLTVVVPVTFAVVSHKTIALD
jgi:hypothetical protein